MWSVFLHGEKQKRYTGQIITENNSNTAVCTEREKRFKTAVILKWAETVRILKKMLWVGVYRTSVCYLLYVLLWSTVRTAEVYMSMRYFWLFVPSYPQQTTTTETCTIFKRWTICVSFETRAYCNGINSAWNNSVEHQHAGSYNERYRDDIWQLVQITPCIHINLKKCDFYTSCNKAHTFAFVTNN